MFPLRAAPGGVLEREGHTEGSVDLARLAGLQPAAVICEITNPDGSMAKGIEVHRFARRHNLVMLSIPELVEYRRCNPMFRLSMMVRQAGLKSGGSKNHA
jgi:3,4-dihydroxy 2-butanone 4-phosphate synthase